jgi:hypothetical protein
MTLVFHLLAALAAASVVGLMGYHIITGASLSAPLADPLPSGIAGAMASEAAEDAPPVKANVVVFRSTDAGMAPFMEIVAAHKFDSASDHKPSSGWCYIELQPTAGDGIDKTIPLSKFDGKSVTAEPQALKGFQAIGLDASAQDRATRACPWMDRL